METHTATPSSWRRVDGVNAPYNFDFHTVHDSTRAPPAAPDQTARGRRRSTWPFESQRRSAATSADSPRGRSAACHHTCTGLSASRPRRRRSRCGTGLLLLAGPRSLRSGCASPGVYVLMSRASRALPLGAVSSRAPRPADAVRRGPTAGSPARPTRARLVASRLAWPLLGSHRPLAWFMFSCALSQKASPLAALLNSNQRRQDE